MQAVEDAPLAVVLCDMNVPGLPLTYVNKAFEQMTGYRKGEAEGTNCRFLQGQHTEQEQVTVIIRALQRAEPCQLTLTNYKKNGQEFQNLFSMKLSRLGKRQEEVHRNLSLSSFHVAWPPATTTSLR